MSNFKPALSGRSPHTVAEVHTQWRKSTPSGKSPHTVAEVRIQRQEDHIQWQKTTPSGANICILLYPRFFLFQVPKSQQVTDVDEKKRRKRAPELSILPKSIHNHIHTFTISLEPTPSIAIPFASARTHSSIIT